MPVRFTDERVCSDATDHGVRDESLTIEQQRETLAAYIEREFKDPVEAQEIRSGRPWDEFTASDLEAIERRSPSYWRRNPGLMRRRKELGL